LVAFLALSLVIAPLRTLLVIERLALTAQAAKTMLAGQHRPAPRPVLASGS
jgi:hypothetical protein